MWSWTEINLPTLRDNILPSRSRADAAELLRPGTGVEVDRHAVADGRQPFGLTDDPLGVLVTEKNEGDPCHLGTC